jgi:hypothetical protein
MPCHLTSETTRALGWRELEALAPCSPTGRPLLTDSTSAHSSCNTCRQRRGIRAHGGGGMARILLGVCRSAIAGEVVLQYGTIACSARSALFSRPCCFCCRPGWARGSRALTGAGAGVPAGGRHPEHRDHPVLGVGWPAGSDRGDPHRAELLSAAGARPCRGPGGQAPGAEGPRPTAGWALGARPGYGGARQDD